MAANTNPIDLTTLKVTITTPDGQALSQEHIYWGEPRPVAELFVIDAYGEEVSLGTSSFDSENRERLMERHRQSFKKSKEPRLQEFKIFSRVLPVMRIEACVTVDVPIEG